MKKLLLSLAGLAFAAGCGGPKPAMCPGLPATEGAVVYTRSDLGADPTDFVQPAAPIACTRGFGGDTNRYDCTLPEGATSAGLTLAVTFNQDPPSGGSLEEGRDFTASGARWVCSPGRGCASVEMLTTEGMGSTLRLAADGAGGYVVRGEACADKAGALHVLTFGGVTIRLP